MVKKIGTPRKLRTLICENLSFVGVRFIRPNAHVLNTFMAFYVIILSFNIDEF